jgi:hypothetical protein
MSDDDEDRARSNADRPHKPQDTQRPDRAPRGAVGNNIFYQPRAPGLSPGGSVTRAPQKSPQEQAQTVRTAEEPARDKFKQTHDKDVDRFYSKTHDMVKTEKPQEKESERGKLKDEWAKAQTRRRDRGHGLG